MARRFSASFPSVRGRQGPGAGPAPVRHDAPRSEESTDRPVIVDCALYTKGQRQQHVDEIEPALAEAERCDGFVWIGLREPGDAEFAEIAAKFNLPALAVEDAVRAHQRPKLELYPEILFAVIKPVRYVDSAEMVELAEIAVFLGQHFVITVRHGHSDIPARVRKELDADPTLLAHGPAVVLYRILDMAVDEYQDVIDDIGIDIDEIETQVFGGEHGDHSERIYKLKREVLEFKRAVTPLTTPTLRLSENELRGVPEEIRPYFRDVHDHVLRASDAIEGYDSLLTNVLQADLAQVSVRQNQTAMRQNEDMRKISAWAAIALVPTAVAGIYGMNFDNMPELHTRYGYFVVLTAIALACSTLYGLFRRNNWL
jgi:magnesium transporter